MHRVSLVLAAFAVALSVIPAARTERVHVRVEGKTQTVYGSTDPAMEVRKQQTHPPVTDLSPTPLDVLEAASLRGEFYYHVTVTGFGPYVDQIGRFPAGGSSGWVFKVDGVSPPVGADRLRLSDGDRLLWYWATFGETGGPPTLRLVRQRSGCYRVLAEDDQGKTSPATGAVLTVDRRRIRTKAARACIGPHRGLVRAVRAGSVRSNAVR